MNLLGDYFNQACVWCRKWLMDRPLVFDDTKRHNAWNNTANPRVVMIIDLPRRGNAASQTDGFASQLEVSQSSK